MFGLFEIVVKTFITNTDFNCADDQVVVILLAPARERVGVTVKFTGFVNNIKIIVTDTDEPSGHSGRCFFLVQEPS